MHGKLLVPFFSFSTKGCLKGQCHEMIYFFEGLNILISTFCECADGFQGLSQKLFTTCTIIKFFFASLKIIFKMLTETSSEFPSL
jgi:hypothetical protein